MFEFFDKVVGFFERAWEMLVNLIESLLLAITVATNASGIGLALVRYMPMMIGAAITVVTAVSVVKLLAGR